MYIPQKYLKDLFSVYEAVPQSLGSVRLLVLQNIQLSGNSCWCPIIDDNSMYALRPHRSSSYFTNLNLGFQRAERMGYQMVKTKSQ